MSQAILESPWGEETYHMCVVKTIEETCVDWTIENDWDCGGNDIAPDPYVPGNYIFDNHPIQPITYSLYGLFLFDHKLPDIIPVV